jgi:IS5 family transposase
MVLRNESAADSGLTHPLVTTPANTADVNVAYQLLHGKEPVAISAAGYQSVDERNAQKRVQALWHVAIRLGKLPDNQISRALEKLEQLKASARAEVEHPIHIINNLFDLERSTIAG